VRPAAGNPDRAAGSESLVRALCPSRTSGPAGCSPIIRVDHVSLLQHEQRRRPPARRGRSGSSVSSSAGIKARSAASAIHDNDSQWSPQRGLRAPAAGSRFHRRLPPVHAWWRLLPPRRTGRLRGVAYRGVRGGQAADTVESWPYRSVSPMRVARPDGLRAVPDRLPENTLAGVWSHSSHAAETGS
jgi:hypothetical protein